MRKLIYCNSCLTIYPDDIARPCCKPHGLLYKEGKLINQEDLDYLYRAIARQHQQYQLALERERAIRRAEAENEAKHQHYYYNIKWNNKVEVRNGNDDGPGEIPF